MRRLFILLIITFILISFDENSKPRLLYSSNNYLRSSLNLYSDGCFYESNASGCVGQDFSWGQWIKTKDTFTFIYSKENIFSCDIKYSKSSSNKFQTIKIIDKYDNPVRLEHINFDSSYVELFNMGTCKILKGKTLYYNNRFILDDSLKSGSISNNADTIIYKWNCNREIIESIDGNRIYFDLKHDTTKLILKNKRLISL